MEVIGHWESLAEAQRLTRSVLLQGVIEEIINEGELIPRLPVFQITGLKLEYNREIDPGTAAFYNPGEQIPWGGTVKYNPVEAALKEVMKQNPLDNFIAKNYRNINDYRAQMISELRKACMITVENENIYGPSDKGYDGLHALSDDTPAMTIHNSNNGDGTGDPLSFDKLDQLIDLVKPAPDILLMNGTLIRRISQAGRGTLAAAPLILQIADNSRIAAPVTYYRDVPLVKSTYMTQTETITSGNAYSAKTGGLTSSIFAIRFGQVLDGGLCLGFGGQGGNVGELFEHVYFENLENYNAEGHRLLAYLCLALGCTKSLARLDGITDAAPTL